MSRARQSFRANRVARISLYCRPMGSSRVQWIEAGVDTGAALLFALAVAFVVFAGSADPALRLAVPALAFAASFYALRGIDPTPAFDVAAFKCSDFAPAEADELVLTDADRLAPAELLLDRALVHIGPGSRVVRLFEPAAMPTPGELKARIDRHLTAGHQTPNADASGALFEALSELRRSLR